MQRCALLQQQRPRDIDAVAFAGDFTFAVLHTQILDPAWFGNNVVMTWLYNEGPNPFSCAAMGEAVSVTATYVVSKRTQLLPQGHVDDLFESVQS